MNAKRQKLHEHPNVLAVLSDHSKAVIALLTRIRAADTNCQNFVQLSNRVCHMLVEEGVANSPMAVETTVQTPTQHAFTGLQTPMEMTDCCVISIVRSGDIIADVFKQLHPSTPVGKVLIQRLEHTEDKRSELKWQKIPPNIAQKRTVFVVDPMLATGGSAINCFKVLRDLHGVSPSNIVFLNIISCPEGLHRLQHEFPEVKIVTCDIDAELDADKYICPGVGDYGDRYYDTLE